MCGHKKPYKKTAAGSSRRCLFLLSINRLQYAVAVVLSLINYRYAVCLKVEEYEETVFQKFHLHYSFIHRHRLEIELLLLYNFHFFLNFDIWVESLSTTLSIPS